MSTKVTKEATKEETKSVSKPLSLALNEFKISIEKAIGECNLPSYIIEPVLCNYWMQVKASSDAQATAESVKYFEKIKTDKEDTEHGIQSK